MLLIWLKWICLSMSGSSSPVKGILARCRFCYIVTWSGSSNFLLLLHIREQMCACLCLTTFWPVKTALSPLPYFLLLFQQGAAANNNVGFPVIRTSTVLEWKKFRELISRWDTVVTLYLYSFQYTLRLLYFPCKGFPDSEN